MISLNAIGSACIQQRCCSHNIRSYKRLWICNRTVYMTLCCKVHNHIRFFCFKQPKDKLPICNITLHKLIIRLIFYWLQVFKIACISQEIQIQNLVFRILIHHMLYKIASNKSSTTSYNDLHSIILRLIVFVVQFIYILSI